MPAGPDVRNSLPPEIRLTEKFATFKKKLKTPLFEMIFFLNVAFIVLFIFI